MERRSRLYSLLDRFEMKNVEWNSLKSINTKSKEKDKHKQSIIDREPIICNWLYFVFRKCATSKFLSI